MEKIGILDPEGKNNNPLTGKPYSDEYKKLARVWSTFPAYKKALEIIADVIKYQVILIVADTGSGKTVLAPKFVLHAFNYDGRVAITFPKQIIAKSSAEFAAKTLDVEVGKEVGYQYKGSPRDSKSTDTKLLYATDGTIVARLLKDPELKDFDAVIVDEAHERKVQIDFLLYLLRETLKKRPLFRVVIMSATINADLFESYFSKFSFKKIDISGERTYPIQSIFLKSPVRYQEALDEGFKILVTTIHNDDVSKTGAHDILFFVTSSSEAFEMCRKLQEELGKKNIKLTQNDNVFCVEVFAGMNPDNQKLAQDRDLYKTKGNYGRKVVIATNVAESSLTIDGIKFVIDSGFELKSSYDPDHRARRLDRKLITNAQAKQRMGRAGRTEPGVCYHLYTKNDFDNLMEIVNERNFDKLLLLLE